MCQYRPYVHTCDHGTEDEPSNHLVDACDNPPLFPGVLCGSPKFIHWPLETGLPCWDCHQQRMEALGVAVNIWKYLMILGQLGSCQVKDMIPELRHYYALMKAVHEYGADGNRGYMGTHMKENRREDDSMDSPSYWAKGINDLLKLVDMPGVGRVIPAEDPKGGLTQRDLTASWRDPCRSYDRQPVASWRDPCRSYDRQPVASKGGFRYNSVEGVMVEMMEIVSDEEGSPWEQVLGRKISRRL